MISKERLLQLSFDEADFAAEGFLPARFLVRKRAAVPLDALQRDLQLYLDHLREEVLQRIHSDLYDNFLTVDRQLSGVDAELRRVQEPREGLLAHVDRAAKTVCDARALVAHKLRECAGIEAARRRHVHALRIAMMADAAEDGLAALEEVEEEVPPGGGATEAEAGRRLHRVAVECRQLRLQLEPQPGRSPSTVTPPPPAEEEAAEEEHGALLARCRRLCQRFDDLLSHRFAAALRRHQDLTLLLPDAPLAGDPSVGTAPLAACLAAYHALHREADAAALFQAHVAREAVDSVLSWTATGANRSAPPEALAPLLEALLATLERRCLPVAAIAHRVSPRFRLLKATWGCVMDVIVKRMTHIFSPGIPNKFHAHYEAAHALLRGLEAHAHDPEELQDLRRCEETEAWDGKWLLGVYTALRQKEAVAQLTAGLQHHLTPLSAAAGAAGPGPEGYRYAQPRLLHRLLLWLWGPDVWLYPVSDSWLKLTVRVVVAGQRWLAQYLTALPPPPPDAAAASPTTPAPGLLAADLRMVDLVGLHADLRRLQGFLTDALPGIIAQRMGTDGPAPRSPRSLAVGSAATGVCGHCATTLLAAPVAAVEDAAVARVACECVDILLSPLKSIPSLFRMTKKAVPEQPSFFIPSVLGPVQHFRDTHDGAGEGALPAAALGRCVARALEAVADRYHDEVRALLVTNRKAERAVSTLRRKPRGGGEEAAAAAASGEGGEAAGAREKEMSPTDKVYVQLWLDVQEFGRQATGRFGMAADSAAYGRLCALVRRGGWLRGDLFEEPPETLDDD